jgi:hypothetical protein
VGTAAEAVMRAFELSLPHTGEPDLQTATRVDAAGSAVLRLHAVSTQLIEEDGASAEQKRLVARYWYTVPGHKQVASCRCRRRWATSRTPCWASSTRSSPARREAADAA